MKQTIWILEDDAGSRFVYEEMLKPHFELKAFPSISEFKVALATDMPVPPVLIIADVTLEDGNLLQFFSDKASRSNLKHPFIVVSAAEDVSTLKACFSEGALDYLTKPFKKSELLVKIERIISKAANRNALAHLDIQALRIYTTDRSRFIPLTVKEMQILSILMQSDEFRCSKKQLFGKIWGEVSVSSKTLDVHLFHLRQKLEELGLRIDFHAPDTLSLSKSDVSQKAVQR